MTPQNQALLHELLTIKEAGLQVDDNVLNHACADDLAGYVGVSPADLANKFRELYNWTHLRTRTGI